MPAFLPSEKLLTLLNAFSLPMLSPVLWAQMVSEEPTGT